MAENENTGTPAPSEGAPPEAAPPKEPSINDILNFDPFGPKDAPKADAKPAKPTADDKKGAPATGAAPAAKPAPAPAPAPATPPQKTPEQLIAEHTASIRQMLERPAPAPAPAPAKTEPAPPKFNLGIPPQIVSALASEDSAERGAATHALINGVANAVWREAEQLVQNQVNELVSSFPRVIEAHLNARREQERVYNDFFSTYSQFNNEAFYPLVQAHAVQVINERHAQGRPVTGWDQALRDEIANRLFASFPMLKAAPARGNGAAPEPRRGTFTTGGGVPPQQPLQNDMMAVLGFKPPTQ